MNGQAEECGMSIAEKARARRDEKREIAYYVRAKSGPGPRDWSPVGVCFARKNWEGFTLKLNSLPIDRNWNGTLVLVPPFVDEITGEE